MAARNTEVSPTKDTTVDSKLHQAPTAVPEKLTSDLLAGINTLPKAPEAAGLHPVPIEGAPKPNAAAAASSTEVASLRPNPRAGVDAPPPPTQATPPEAAMKTLQSPDASSADKIAAISKIYDSMPKNKHGDVEVTLKDGDKDKKFVISKEDMGHGVKLTHLNYEGPDHRMHPVLRGVERKGHVEQEQDKHGNKADFQGDWWAKNAGGSTIGKFSDSPAAPTPPQRQEEVPLPPRRPDNGTEQTPPLPPERDHRRHREPAPPSHEQQEPPHQRHHRTPAPPHQREQGQEAPPEKTPTPPLPPEKQEHRRRRQGEPERQPGHDTENAPERPGTAKTSDLKKFWVVQPSNFECGSSAEAMAIADKTGTHPFSAGQIRGLSHENGTLGSGAFPHGAGNRNMEEQLRHHGVNAETHTFGTSGAGEMAKLDQELAAGKSAVAYIRNPATGHGHFIYIKGQTEDGRYVVGNSGRHTFINAPPVDRADLNRWLTGNKRGDSYFVSVG